MIKDLVTEPTRIEAGMGPVIAALMKRLGVDELELQPEELDADLVVELLPGVPGLPKENHIFIRLLTRTAAKTMTMSMRSTSAENVKGILGDAEN